MTTLSLAGTASPRSAVLLAWCSGALALGGLVTSVAVGPGQALSGHAYEDAATALLWALLAGLLAQQTRHPVGRIFLAVACCAGVAVASGGYAVLDVPGSSAAAWVASWIWTVSTFIPVTLLPAVFPDGRVAGRLRMVVSGVVGLALMSVGLATAKTLDLTSTRSVPNPVAVPFSDSLFLVGSILVVVAAITAITDLCRRLLRSEGDERRRLAPVAVAAVITLPVLLAAAAAADWGPLIQLVVAPLVPVAITIAILRRNLYDVEVVMRRSLVFAGLTVLVIGGYVLVVQAIANLLRRPPGTVESLIAVGAVAFAFAPARAGFQEAIGRWVYGDRAAPDRALGDVSGMLTAAAEPTLALQSATERLRDALRVPWVEVSSNEGSTLTAGSRPRWAGDGLVESMPLTHLGVSQGSLVVAPRSPRESLNTRDRVLLEQLGGLLAAVLASRRLVADLQRSRSEVVLAREEERRRVRRDLHDGVGPLLTALGIHADVAVLRHERDPGTVGELLRRIRQISEDAVAGLRRVVADLHPVTLDDLGLVGALSELAATLSTDGIDVEVTGTAGVGLPAAVELAAYRIAAEATNNAVRHGNARRVRVELSRSPARLELVVVDDGTGFTGTPAGGLGLSSMRERAEELGGTHALESSPRGTVVRVGFPVGGA